MCGRNNKKYVTEKNVQMVYIYICGDVYCKYNVCICLTVEDVRFQSKGKKRNIGDSSG